jgi:hypothetical protein
MSSWSFWQTQAADDLADEDGGDDDGARLTSLKNQLEECRSELFEVYNQIAELEAVADEAVALESRAEAAENERDDALEKARVFTPRPTPSFERVEPALNEEASSLLTEMIHLYRSFLAPPLPNHKPHPPPPPCVWKLDHTITTQLGSAFLCF